MQEQEEREQEQQQEQEQEQELFLMTPEFREHSEACNRGRKRPRISLTAWRHGTWAVAGLLPHPKGFY